jgi:uncharacterized protein HemX
MEHDADETAELKEMSNEQLKEEAIHSTETSAPSRRSVVAMPVAVLWGLFLVMALVVGLAVFNTYLRWDQASRLEAEKQELLTKVKDLEVDLQGMQVEKEREGQLVRIAAAQEAEGSVLTKLARKTSSARDKVDQIKAETRRYLLLHANFQGNTKEPSLIVEEVCQRYLETTGEGCY